MYGQEANQDDADGANYSLIGAAANFFMLKSKPPNINHDQMIEFLSTFFGHENSSKYEMIQVKANDSELKHQYT